MGSGPNLGFRIYPFNSNGNTTQLSVSLNGETLKITAEIVLFPQNRKTSMTIDGSPKIGKHTVSLCRTVESSSKIKPLLVLIRVLVMRIVL